MAKDKREHVVMVCSECGNLNYYTSRAKTAQKLEIKKFCPTDRKHLPHKEKKRK